MNLQEAMKQFLGACQTEMRLSEKTTRAYSYDLGQFVDFSENKELSTLSSDDIQNYLLYLEEGHELKDSTIRRKIMSLKAFFGYLSSKSIVSETLLDGVSRKPLTVKIIPKILNANDVIRLLEFVDSEVSRLSWLIRPGCGRKLRSFYENAVRDRAIILLLFSSAMRIGELTELDIKDIDLELGTVHVKGRGTRERVLVISCERTIEALRSYQKIRTEFTFDIQALFLNRFGGRLSIFAVENIFERVRKAAGIRRRVTPHALRHTMATMLLNSGVELKKIQGILGHSSMVTTQAYDEVAPRRQRKILAKLSEGRWLGVTTSQDGMPYHARTIRRRRAEP
jgi:integrase/recombinase XerD